MSVLWKRLDMCCDYCILQDMPYVSEDMEIADGKVIRGIAEVYRSKADDQM